MFLFADFCVFAYDIRYKCADCKADKTYEGCDIKSEACGEDYVNRACHKSEDCTVGHKTVFLHKPCNQSCAEYKSEYCADSTRDNDGKVKVLDRTDNGCINAQGEHYERAAYARDNHCNCRNKQGNHHCEEERNVHFVAYA